MVFVIVYRNKKTVDDTASNEGLRTSKPEGGENYAEEA